jgi:hypothetical protein
MFTASDIVHVIAISCQFADLWNAENLSYSSFAYDVWPANWRHFLANELRRFTIFWYILKLTTRFNALLTKGVRV